MTSKTPTLKARRQHLIKYVDEFTWQQTYDILFCVTKFKSITIFMCKFDKEMPVFLTQLEFVTHMSPVSSLPRTVWLDGCINDTQVTEPGEINHVPQSGNSQSHQHRITDHVGGIYLYVLGYTSCYILVIHCIPGLSCCTVGSKDIIHGSI